MVKWIDEKVLQRYFRDNYSKYSRYVEGEEHEIEACEFNQPFDRFPDLFCVIDGNEYPAEVEWLLSHYDHFDHEDHDRFEEQGGFLIVFRKDKEVGNFTQVEIQTDHFKNWFNQNAEKLVNESIEEFEREIIKERQYPKVWSIYVSTRAKQNYEIGSEKGIWGFRESRYKRSQDYIRDIQEDDILLFLGPIVSTLDFSGHFQPRTRFEKFLDTYVDEEALTLNHIGAYKVTDGYWNEMETYDYRTIWPGESETENTFPHRIEFHPNPIFEFENISLHEVAKPALRTIHKTMYQSMWELDYPHFMEIVSNFPGN